LYDNFEGLRNFVDSFVSSIIGFFAKIGNGIKNAFVTAYEFVKNIFSSMYDFFKGLWEKIVGLFGKVGTTIGDAIGGAFKTVVNSIIGFAERIINGFINAINRAIGTINKIPGVNIPLIAQLQIPQLAKGGIFNRPMIAQIAEAGDSEAVIPINNKPRSRNLWETAGRMAGFTQPQDGGLVEKAGRMVGFAKPQDGGLVEKAGRMAGFAGAKASGMGSITVPIILQIDAKGADASASERIKSAGNDILNKVRTIVREEIPNALIDIKLGKDRRSFA
jgi:hypothetical protein